MTYCVALRLNRGIGLRRRHAHQRRRRQYRPVPQDALLAQAGRARAGAARRRQPSLTQSVVSLLNEQLVEREEEPEAVNLFNVPSMYRAARLVGDAVREHQGDRRRGAGIDEDRLCRLVHPRRPDRQASAPRLFQIYSEGNFIEATDDTPYFQIGEHKYGKPILDRVAQPTMRLGEAAKLVLLSFNSTLRSNLSVGMPIDILLYERDSLDLRREKRIFQDDEYFKKLSSAWSEALRSAFTKIEEFNL